MLETRVSGAVKDAETRNEMKLQQNRNSLLFFSYVGCVIVVRDLFISFIFILIKWCAQIAISSKTNSMEMMCLKQDSLSSIQIPIWLP